MKRATEYPRTLSPVGLVLDKIQQAQPVEMQKDSVITKVNRKISGSLITRVRYGLQCPTPLFIKTIIDCFALTGSIVNELLKAMHAMMKGVKILRIHHAVARENAVAAEILKKKKEQMSPFSRMKAFASRWFESLRRALDAIYHFCSGFGVANYLSGAYTRVPINIF